MARKKDDLPWTGRTPCNCDVPDPAGRRISPGGISYNPCRKCSNPISLTDEQIDNRAWSAQRRAQEGR